MKLMASDWKGIPKTKRLGGKEQLGPVEAVSWLSVGRVSQSLIRTVKSVGWVGTVSRVSQSVGSVGTVAVSQSVSQSEQSVSWFSQVGSVNSVKSSQAVSRRFSLGGLV